MSFSELLSRSQYILNLLRDLGRIIIDFAFTSLDFGPFGSFLVIELLFGAGLITFLTVKIVASLIT